MLSSFLLWVFCWKRTYC